MLMPQNNRVNCTLYVMSLCLLITLSLTAKAATLKKKEKTSMLENEVGHVFMSEAGKSLAPSQRLHLVLLGVEDVQATRKFYEALGWQRSPSGHAGFEKFDLGGYALCLLPASDLAKDAGEVSDHRSSYKGVAFVYLTKTAEEVSLILQKAVEAGGTLVKPATRTPYGIAGYFKDPNGYLFEVDYEEVWVFDDEHRLVVDELNDRKY